MTDSKKEIKMTFERTLKEIRDLVKGSQIKEKVNQTGHSFFEGTKRFCKLVKTNKDHIYLELNVKLSDDTIKKLGPNLQTFSKVEASKKHLGSLVHILKTKNEEEVKTVLKEAYQIFREELKKNVEQANGRSNSSRSSKTGKASSEQSETSKNVAAAKSSECVVRKLTKEDIERLQAYDEQKKNRFKIEVKSESPKVEEKEEVVVQ